MDPNNSQRKPSKSEILASAKVVAGAAKAGLGHKPAEGEQKVDKGKVAGATANLLGAASKYGKLDEKAGVGKYVDKAETYLHHYHSSHSHSGPNNHHQQQQQQPSQPHANSHDGGNKHGDYLKMAQGFLKKH